MCGAAEGRNKEMWDECSLWVFFLGAPQQPIAPHRDTQHPMGPHRVPQVFISGVTEMGDSGDTEMGLQLTGDGDTTNGNTTN